MARQRLLYQSEGLLEVGAERDAALQIATLAGWADTDWCRAGGGAIYIYIYIYIYIAAPIKWLGVGAGSYLGVLRVQ